MASLGRSFSAFSRAPGLQSADFSHILSTPMRSSDGAMDPTTIPPETAETVLFRPAKKRKIYRQRVPHDVPSPIPPQLDPARSPGPVLPATNSDNVSATDEELEGTRVSMSEILRLRKLRKHRVGGVEFRASITNGRGDDGQEGAMVLHENSREGHEKDEVQQGGRVVRRFAKQTGLVGDVDKHMMAYIDSELAKRRLNAISTTGGNEDAGHRAHGEDSSSSGRAIPSKSLEKQPATLGKLLEIDLGNEARDRNVMRTEQARRRLDGEDVEDESAPEGKSKKPRLGRDGKPWRERKRRTSEDIRRDKLVEEVLRENRLDMYEEPLPPAITTSGDGEADDQIAEAFRREFMDAVSQRQRRRAAPAPPGRGTGGKKEEEIMKGPKLGGSRSARAAMREAHLKEIKAGRK